MSALGLALPFSALIHLLPSVPVSFSLNLNCAIRYNANFLVYFSHNISSNIEKVATTITEQLNDVIDDTDL